MKINPLLDSIRILVLFLVIGAVVVSIIDALCDAPECWEGIGKFLVLFLVLWLSVYLVGFFNKRNAKKEAIADSPPEEE